MTLSVHLIYYMSAHYESGDYEFMDLIYLTVSSEDISQNCYHVIQYNMSSLTDLSLCLFLFSFYYILFFAKNVLYFLNTNTILVRHNFKIFFTFTISQLLKKTVSYKCHVRYVHDVSLYQISHDYLQWFSSYKHETES